MSARPPYYFLLALTMLLSLFPAGSAQGNLIPACQGNGGVSTTTVKMGGRDIQPALLLRSTGSLACGPDETALNLVSLHQTIIVSASGTPNQNGEALLNTLSIVAKTLPRPDNPMLVKLEPGQYFVTGTVGLPAFVQLEGSGEQATVISSTVGNLSSPPVQATLLASSNSQVRFLTIVNSGAANEQIAVLIPQTVTNFEVYKTTLLNTSTGSSPTALHNASSGGISLTNSLLSTSGGSNNLALDNTDTATITVNGSTLTGSGGFGARAMINQGLATVQNSTLTASGGSNTNQAIQSSNSGARTTITGSTLSASGVGSRAVNASAGKMQVGNSRLSATTTGGGDVTCIFSYKFDPTTLTALGSNCL